MALVVNGWTIRQYINDKPLEEYTQEERDKFFEEALDKMMLVIGYVPADTEQPARCEGQ